MTGEISKVSSHAHLATSVGSGSPPAPPKGVAGLSRRSGRRRRQEVRELAQRSANAAKEIKALINASGEEVRHGVSLVDQAGEALSTISTEVQAISREICKIIDGAKTQAEGLSEIDAALGQIDRNTQQNAAMVEESSAAIQQLVQEATTLDHLMLQFKVESRTSHSHRRAA
jgi:methyl-accepting chemotaxis protein